MCVCVCVYEYVIVCVCVCVCVLQARIQAMHIAKKFYSKPDLAMKIEVCEF